MGKPRNLFTPTRRKLIYLSTAVVILMLVGIVLGSVRYFSTPAAGVLLPTQMPEAKPAVTAQPQLIKVTGKKVSFSYQDSFKPVATNKLTVGEIEKFTYSKLSLPNANLSITVRSLPSEQLADEGTYKLRQSQPEAYTQSTVTTGSTTFTVMSAKNNGFQKVAYVVHNGQVVIISLSSSTDPSDKTLNDALQATLDSWQWR